MKQTNEEMKQGLEPKNLTDQHAESIVFDGTKEESNYKRRYVIYAGHKLIIFKSNTDKKERGILDIKYARLKETRLNNHNIKLYGFVLMARGGRLYFYSENQEEQK